MKNRFQGIFKRYKTITANLAGSDYTFTIGRPNYAIVNNTPVIVNKAAKFFLEPTQQNETQDKLPGVEYYTVTANSDLFQPGDIISGVSALPTVTVVSMPDEQEFLAVKTPRLGSFIDMGADVYTNVYFDYMSANTDGNPEFIQLETGQSVPRRKIIIWDRGPTTILEGSTFYDYESGYKWHVALTDVRSRIMIVYLNSPNRT